MAPNIIALMGATGSGKSSMIKLATGDERIVIGHGLTSQTQDITSYPVNFRGCEITLVDTPGFDDTYRSDSEILQSIVEWLTRTYRDGTRLSGIIYLHKITDVRMSGSALRNLRVFRELCGKDCFKNVALCPTFWHAAGEEDSVLRERLMELTDTEGYWGGMIASGSRLLDEPQTQDQVITMLLEMLFLKIDGDNVPLQVQREIADERKSTSDTSAFTTLMRLELDRQRQESEEKMAKTKRAFEEEMERRERTHSEDLADMMRLFEDKLATIEDTNRKLREQVQSQIRRPSDNSIPRKAVPQQIPCENLQRAVTAPADVNPLASQISRRERQRGHGEIKFFEEKVATIEGTNEKLQEQIQSQRNQTSANSDPENPAPQQVSLEWLPRPGVKEEAMEHIQSQYATREIARTRLDKLREEVSTSLSYRNFSYRNTSPKVSAICTKVASSVNQTRKVVDRQARLIPSQLAQLSSSQNAVDSEERRQGRAKLMAVAEQRVYAQLQDMDEKISKKKMHSLPKSLRM